MTKKILFLSAETFPPIYAHVFVFDNRILNEKGYRFYWIMPSVEVEQVRATDWDENRVWLIPKVRSTGLVGLIKEYITHLRSIQEAVSKALEEVGEFDMVQVCDDPIMAYVAWRLSRKKKIPFIYQISHLKEEENVLYATMRLYGNPAKNYVKGKAGLLVRNWLLRKADLVFPVSDQMEETLASYGVRRERMVTLPEGVDTSIEPSQFDEAAKEIRRELNLEDKKVLIYVGTMNRFRQLDFLLRVFGQVLDSSPDVHLLMVGDGRDPGDLPWLKKAAGEVGVQNHITFTGKVPRSKVPAYIRASDIGLSPVPPNLVYINSSPIKILEYLALGISCVASKIPDQYRVITESQGGLCVPHKEEEFARAIDRLLALSDEQRKEIGRKGRTYVKKSRDFAVLASKVVESYEKHL